jgi:hypothetical protein
LVAHKTGQEEPERLQEAPNMRSRRLQEAPRPPEEHPKRRQERPRRPQERPKRPQELQDSLKRPQEPVKKAQNPPESSQQPPKTPTRFFRSTWYGSRSRKNRKIQPARALSGLSRCPPSFSEAPGPAAVFGKNKKLKSYLQRASKTLKIAGIDESQRPCLKSQSEKRRAGGGDPPWGNQSAARPGGARSRRVRSTTAAQKWPKLPRA